MLGENKTVIRFRPTQHVAAFAGDRRLTPFELQGHFLNQQISSPPLVYKRLWVAGNGHIEWRNTEQ
jgi:hypothetical protein